MSETKEKILKFKIGEESFPTVLSSNDLEISPFVTSIKNACAFIDDLVKSNSSLNDNNWQYNTRNNIVAFLGERGSGKTSCMRTSIKDAKDIHTDWLFIDEIDPSFFDEKHNILEIFIGSLYRLFEEFKNKWKSLPREKQNSLRNIQDSFRKVKAALRYVEEKADNKDEYEIDELKHLDEGGNLRSILKGLISLLLSFDDNKKCLVISIDDLDLNISQSYKMLEYIRKYLILPNVVILIAAKYQQLFDSICLDLTKHYKGIEYRVTHKDIAEMAERYLNKILPLDQRFDMPTVESYLDAKLELYDGSNNRINDNENITVAQKVPALIFEKTRYLFYNSSGMPSLVIPRNLRNLRMLVKLLVAMKDFDDNHLVNQTSFKNYFFEEWLGIIEPEYRSFAKVLLDEENLAKINRFVISNLYTFFLKDVIPFDALSEEIKDSKSKRIDSYTRERELLYHIINPSNSYWNVSIGDVVVILNTVKKIHDSSQIAALLFFIETFYSIKLYETYNLLTDKTNNDGIIIDKEELSTSPVLKTSIRGDVPQYFRLVGGSFFSPSGDSFIRTSQIGDIRERRLINGGFLLDEIRRVEKEYETVFSKKKNSRKIPPELSARLRLCEFFMLTIKNREDLKDSKFDARLINEPLYFKPYGNNVRNLIFDALSPFVNAVYPEFAYSRFNKSIYRFAKKDPCSLVSLMTNQPQSRDRENTTWELMSKAAIRNMEILEDLTDWLHDKKPGTGAGGKNNLLLSLSNFYYNFHISHTEGELPQSGYFVKTYHRYSDAKKVLKDNEKPYYLIDYSTYSLLRYVLMELIDENLSNANSENFKYRKSLFYGIFSRNDIFLQMDTYSLSHISEVLKRYIRPTIVDLSLGGYEDTINVEILAQILVGIRLDHGYDFDGHLPLGLLSYYKQYFDTEYNKRLSTLSQDKQDLENNVNTLNETKSKMPDELKQLNKSINQINNEIDTIHKNLIKIEAKIEEDHKNINLFSKELERESLTKAEETRIRKDLINTSKDLNSQEASRSAALQSVSLLDSRKHDTEKELEMVHEKNKSLYTQLNIATHKLNSINREMTRLEHNMTTPIPLESID